MDKKEAVKRLYERGVLISPRELETMTEEQLNKLLEAGPGPKPADPPDTITITRIGEKQKKKLSPQDFADHYNRKYEAIKTMLLKKMDVVSITNAKAGSFPCGIIGIVREVTQRGFIFEDPTGELEVVKSGIGELDTINLDDVLGLRGFVREGKLFPKEIVLPDIPLNHNIGRISRASLELSDSKIMVSNPGTTRTAIIKSNPDWLTLSRGQESLTLLAFKAVKTTKEEMISCLRKRSLPEPATPRITNHLIDPIPDLVWLIQGDEWVENYKGVTIISCVSKARVNLETREVSFETSS